ncbi:MAG: helix-turn-helix transcriptional regulator [Gammaproteobacteria bacterium]
MNDRILRLSSVLEITGLSRSTIYSLVAKGVFPKQIKLSEKASGWLDSEVSAWIDSRVQASRMASGGER